MRTAAIAFVLVALIRIVSTYHVFNNTADEAHFAAGTQWIADGEYDYEYQHPPLARVLLAVGPYLSGVRPEHRPSIWDEANHELAQGGHYWRNLTLARIGVLPFFVLCCWILWKWAEELYGSGAALGAVGLFTFLPPILAHSGLATLDMAAAATTFSAAYAWYRFLLRPSMLRAALLGVAVAAAVLSKFSALLFVPVLGLVVFGWWVFLIRFWRYNGASSPVVDMPRNTHGRVNLYFGWSNLALWSSFALFVTGLSIALMYRGCLHGFYAGIGQVIAHNDSGHDSWLMGEFRTRGWWYFFPVVLAVKTPLGFLALAGIGAWKARMPLCCAAGLLVTCLPAHLNLGVRHILVIYPFLAMMAGAGLVGLLRWPVWNSSS